MGVCGGDCLMRWRNGRRFREVLFENVCVECGQWRAVVMNKDGFEARPYPRAPTWGRGFRGAVDVKSNAGSQGWIWSRFLEVALYCTRLIPQGNMQGSFAAPINLYLFFITFPL